ncbi:MAG: DUF4369 domain-containing protein [Aureibaculum sp.]|nr:DUF4369 domain-containing protein [Aureibaculum sp.]
MKKIIVFIIVSVVVFGCNKEKTNTMLVRGEIKNLKKGVLFLQKIKDTLLITVDSISLDGVNTFTLTDEVESPEIYYLTLDRSPSRQISFFGEKGTITIDTRLDKFVFGATINGLTNQQLLDEYYEMKNKFSGKRLDLIKADFDAKKSEDSLIIDSIQSQINNLIKRKYFYTANFAVIHSDNEIAPYLALTELYDANIALLDTINNSLSPKIRDSKYGKKLESFITEIKSKE